jgi:hypothetical protein
MHLGSCVHSRTHWLRPRHSHHKRGRYRSAKIDDISLWPTGAPSWNIYLYCLYCKRSDVLFHTYLLLIFINNVAADCGFVVTGSYSNFMEFCILGGLLNVEKKMHLQIYLSLTTYLEHSIPHFSIYIPSSPPPITFPILLLLLSLLLLHHFIFFKLLLQSYSISLPSSVNISSPYSFFSYSSNYSSIHITAYSSSIHTPLLLLRSYISPH